MDKSWGRLREVHKIFGTLAPDEPTVLSDFYAQRRVKWIKEEADEILEAGDDIVGQVDGFLDVIVFAIGGLVELGVKPEVLYDIVIDSQFAKVWPDGQPRIRETDGKWLKPPNWQAPEPLLKEEIERQINASRSA